MDSLPQRALAAAARARALESHLQAAAEAQRRVRDTEVLRHALTAMGVFESLAEAEHLVREPLHQSHGLRFTLEWSAPGHHAVRLSWLCHRHGLEIDYAYVTSLVEIGQALGRFMAAHPDRACWHAHEEGEAGDEAHKEES